MSYRRYRTSCQPWPHRRELSELINLRNKLYGLSRARVLKRQRVTSQRYRVIVPRVYTHTPRYSFRRTRTRRRVLNSHSKGLTRPVALFIVTPVMGHAPATRDHWPRLQRSDVVTPAPIYRPDEPLNLNAVLDLSACALATQYGERTYRALMEKVSSGTREQSAICSIRDAFNGLDTRVFPNRQSFV